MCKILQRCFLIFFAFINSTPASAFQIEDAITTVKINAIGGLKYDLVRFRVKPGAKVKIIFTNNDDMSHNLVFTTPGARQEVVNAALQLGEQGMKLNYIPPVSKVLWSIPILAPGQTSTIIFTVSKEKGIYPYVCTYPGHGFIMYGAMYVTEEDLPATTNDRNIPSQTNNTVGSAAGEHEDHLKAASMLAHPYKPVPPYLYRIFMPDASPAAIAVSLPQKLSYCWDAGTCCLRYAWDGGFLDNTDVWKGHKDAYANILGKVFFRDTTAFPLHTDDPASIPVVKFKGYRFINRYPEFHYLIDGIEVFELIKPKADGTGLIRTFRIPKNNKNIWFVFGSGDGVSYKSSVGKWQNEKLKLLPGQAQEFTIIMTKSKS